MVSRLPMRLLRPVLFVLMLVAAPALARAPATAPIPAAAEPLQFYVFSFTDTPVAEAAQDVVGGALAYDLTIDPAIDGIVTFRADGWYSSDALLKDFGAALLDQDIALMRTAPGAYAVIPRANVPMMLARSPGQRMPPRRKASTPQAAAPIDAASVGLAQPP